MREKYFEVREFHGQDSFRVGIFSSEENAVEWTREEYGETFYEEISKCIGMMEGAFINVIVVEEKAIFDEMGDY